METNLEYLKKLDYPQFAVTEDLWIHWKEKIKNITSDNPDQLLKLYDMPIGIIATKLGILWEKKSSEKLSVILSQPIRNIISKKYISNWWKKAVVITVCSLAEATNEKIIYIINEKSNKQNNNISYQTDLCRIQIQQAVSEMSKDFMETLNFQKSYKQFIKIFITTLLSDKKLNSKNMALYVNIFIKRFINCESYLQISKSLNINNSIINNVLSKFKNIFLGYFIDEDGYFSSIKFEKYKSRWEKSYDIIFDKLSENCKTIKDYQKRNRQFKNFKLFENYFFKI